MLRSRSHSPLVTDGCTPVRCRIALIVLLLLLGMMLASPVGARADENIYARDLAAARRGLARAQTAWDAATADAQRAELQLPVARAVATQKRSVAERRAVAADRARMSAARAERRVRDRRERARARVVAAQSITSADSEAWRSWRVRRVSIAAVLFALAAGAALSAVVARWRRRIEGSLAAGRSAVALAMSTALYLCGLFGAASAAGAWRFSLALLTGAAVGVLVLVLGTAAGWRRWQPARPLYRRFIWPSTALLVLCGIGTVLLAVGDERPDPPQVPAATMRLADQAERDAPMPHVVRIVGHHAGALDVQALRADERATDAETARDDLATLYRTATTRRWRLRQSIDRWSARLIAAQRDYDDYQELLDATAPDPTIPDDVGDLDALDRDLPDVDVPSNDLSTTEDFGSGRGGVGLCADGTLSDSIGRPGACSHHGGVG